MTDISASQLAKPFRLPLRSRWVTVMVERVLGLDVLSKCYEFAASHSGTDNFLSAVLEYLQVTLAPVDQFNSLANIPKEGPLLIVANHPLGGLEGVALTRLLMTYRPDIRVLTNDLLRRMPELRSTFIGVDVLSKNAARDNIKGIREATQHLSNGGALLLFPAGKVASIDIKARAVKDHPWNRLAGNFLRRSGASCLPIYVNGYNSRLFYFLALIHPLLRTALLPRELANKRGRELELIIGETIPPEEFRKLKDDSAITDYLRLSTEFLKQRKKQDKPSTSLVFEPLTERVSSADRELAQLAAIADCRLIESGDFDVYCAPYQRLGSLIESIGHAREVTFRAAGEGTGNKIDSDRFDPHYLHLFIWDKQQRRVVGGYRIGRVDEIVAAKGIDALYSRTLFEFNQQYLQKIGKTLEMGRSFIHPDYQRMPQALDLLWRGIGSYVARNPEYHTLFGAVSISNEHSDMVRALIAECMLESFCAEQRFLDDVTPVEPLRVSGKVWTNDMLASLNHVSVLNKLVGRCEPGKALPTLLRHYLSLNGKFVCWSVNKVFNDSLDGLILVDLRKTPNKYLKRYLGKIGAAEFLAFWGEELPDQVIPANTAAVDNAQPVLTQSV